MVDPSLIQKIKSATVAIGIVDKGKLQPKIIVGSGFLFDPAGYVMTAGHVAEKCQQLAQSINDSGMPVEMATFRAIISKTINFAVDVIEKFTVIDLIKIPEGYVGPMDLDVACGKPATKHENFPSLEIKPTCEYALADSLLMCGYPRGEYTLSLKAKKNTGIRLSPVLQFGKIAGLLAWDGDETPYGLQTDIIGTGGSSGSPILNSEGKVIAIAQKIIPSAVYDNKDCMIGESNSGITYGVTSCVFSNFVSNTKKYYDTGKDEGPVVVPLTTLSAPEFVKV